MPKGVKKEDEGRDVIGTEGGRYFRAIPEDRRLLACDLLEWSRAVDEHRLSWERWQHKKGDQLITITRPQALALSNISLHEISADHKLALLSQDSYGHVIAQNTDGRRWKLPYQGGYEELP